MHHPSIRPSRPGLCALVMVAGAVLPAGVLLAAPAGVPGPAADQGLRAFDPAVALAGPIDGPNLPNVRHPLDLIERPGELAFTGQLIVRPWQRADLLARGLTAEQAEAVDKAARALILKTDRVIRHWPDTDEYIVAVSKPGADAADCRELRATGLFQYATPDWLCWPVVVPNDAQFGQQWHHVTMQSAQAWDILSSLAVPNSVAVAISDSGVNIAHEDLAARALPGFNSVGTGLAQSAGGDISDVNNHGTWCAGSASATGNNAVGVSGMGFNLGLVPVRCTNNTSGTAFLSDILSGARWGAANGARIASCSFTGVTSPSVQTSGSTIRTTNNGVLVYAAGNANSLLSDAADWPDVVIAAASDQSDNRAGFSNFGLPVDVAAPGVAIRTTDRGGGYASVNGTSFATPITAGALAMIAAANPALSSADLEATLKGSANDLGSPGRDSSFGFGRVNLFRALTAATAPTTAPFAVADSLAAPTQTPTDIDVLANDWDPRNRTLTISAHAATSDRGGTVSLVGGGSLGRPALRYTAPATPGPDSFTYTAFNAIGQTAVGTVTIDVRPLSGYRVADAVPNPAQGLVVRYYATSPSLSSLPNFNALTPLATEVVQNIHFPSTDGVFANSGRTDDVGATFTGFFRAPTTGSYTFFTESDDGSDLFIGTTRVVNNDGLHAMIERSGSIDLRAGLHALRVNFFERAGGAGVIARVSGPGLLKQIIGIENFRWAPRAADIAGTDGTPGADTLVDNGDFSAFFAAFFEGCSTAGAPCSVADIAATDGSIGADGNVDNGDFSLFFGDFFAAP